MCDKFVEVSLRSHERSFLIKIVAHYARPEPKLSFRAFVFFLTNLFIYVPYAFIRYNNHIKGTLSTSSLFLVDISIPVHILVISIDRSQKCIVSLFASRAFLFLDQETKGLAYM